MRKFILIIPLLWQITGLANAQSINKQRINTITTAVPFLRIPGNYLSSSFGEISSGSPNGFYDGNFTQNPSLIAGKSKRIGLVSNIVSNIVYPVWWMLKEGKLFDFDVTFAFDSLNGFYIGHRIFNLGKITFTDYNGNPIYESQVREYALSMRYARKLSNNFRIGGGVKFIYSNLASSQQVNGVELKPVYSAAGDIGFDYRGKVNISNMVNLTLQTGLSIQNIGPKVEYPAYEKDFIPTVLQVPYVASFRIAPNNYVEIFPSIGYEVEKLLVPTPDSLNRYRKQSAFEGMITSFSDAPGGPSEELEEYVHKFGSGVTVNLIDLIQLYLNGGIYLENKYKGNHKYGTYGGGISIMGITFGYSGIKSFSSAEKIDAWGLTAGFIYNFDTKNGFAKLDKIFSK